MTDKEIKIPDGKPYTVPFDGKALWVSMKNKYILFYPVKGELSQNDIEEMCLVMDLEEATGNRYYSLQKIAKNEFFKFFGIRVDCQHDFIIMRLFIKNEDGEFIENKFPQDDKDCVKIQLLKLPKGSTKPLPINLNNRSKELN